MTYHLREIVKGEVGELSKIEEELEELLKAHVRVQSINLENGPKVFGFSFDSLSVSLELFKIE